MVGAAAADREPSAAGARLRAGEADPPLRRHVERRARLCEPVRQGRARHRRRHRSLRQLHAARLARHHRAPDGGADRALPVLLAAPDDAAVGRHRRRLSGCEPDHLEDAGRTASTSTAAGGRAAGRRRRARAMPSPISSPATSRTPSPRRSRWSASRPARSSPSTAPRRWRIEATDVRRRHISVVMPGLTRASIDATEGYATASIPDRSATTLRIRCEIGGSHVPDPLPLLRRARHLRVRAWRRGAHRAARGRRGADRFGMGGLSSSCAPTRRA